MFEKITKCFQDIIGQTTEVAAKEPKQTVFFVDVSGSTFLWILRDRFFSRMEPTQQNDPRLMNGSGFLINHSIKNYVRQLAENAPPSIETMGADSDLMAMLTNMSNSQHPYVMITIGNAAVPSLVRETSNLVATVEEFSNIACAPGTDNRTDITFGTSLVGALKGLNASAYVKRAKDKKDPQTFTVLTDGQCGDIPSETVKLMRETLNIFPNAMFKIIAFVMDVKPKQCDITEEKLGNIAGLDVFHNLNKCFSKNILCFEVHYLLHHTNTGRIAIAEQPEILSLAIGKEAGVSMSFTALGVKVIIPEKTTDRNELVMSIIQNVTKSEFKDELAQVQNPDMNEWIQNFTTLGSYMRPVLMQNALSALVTAWIKAKHGSQFTNEQIKKTVKAYLQTNVFGPRQEALLNGNNGVTLRTQEQRQANFQTILNWWDVLKNHVVNDGMIGNPIILINKDDIRQMACVTISPELLANYNNDKLLFYNKFFPVLCGDGNQDYTRMAIRRIISRIANEQGVKLPKINPDKLQMMPHMVAAVAILSVIARNAGESLITETFAGTTTVMLQKEQRDNKSRPPRTLPSAHHMLLNDLGLPGEYTGCSMLIKGGAAEIFKYASGLSDTPPVIEGLATANNLLVIPPIIDMHTYEEITSGVYYRYKETDQFVSENTYTTILGRRSHVGDTYTSSDFTKVDNGRTDMQQFDRWLTSSTNGTPVPLSSLFI